ncbi:NAD(P)-dependent alcohol dehydrogenase [Algoriphagus sediminis]|uniref:NAD(P)-dependent alcohol dehydrogenase n=1 Tax=Algoriphagus sediminis TaxID=3057113 RepID=A0ABT7YC44_9BACT|nr:NAD(P)-dependent alcohol dehydrogenase [Algoriphagus sediminis]MDN3204083.1 NAD(P)-dependent alcohol dehydrogenase [Algoriphagus sediminis]
MKAAVYQHYGPPEEIEIKEVPKPKPKENEILVKIFATSVTSGDVRLRKSDFPPLFWLPARIIFGLFTPKKKVLGHEFSGVVEEVGSSITKFEVGQEVFGTATLLPNGSYAEYICVPETWKHGVIEHKPKGVSHEKSATLPVGCMTAMFLLEKAKAQSTQKILIYGASGSVGSFAIQLAKNMGLEVTAVCSTEKIEMVKELGAYHVIDYKKEDFTRSGKSFDVVFDSVGKSSKSQGRKVLKNGGSFVSVNMMTKERSEHLLKIKKLAEEGKIKAYIDKTFTLDQIVEAHRYVETGRKSGNVAIKIRD